MKKFNATADELPVEHSDDQHSTLRIISGSEQPSNHDAELIRRMREEIDELRDALGRAERKLHNYEQLLTNSRQREKELRALLDNR